MRCAASAAARPPGSYEMRSSRAAKMLIKRYLLWGVRSPRVAQVLIKSCVSIAWILQVQIYIHPSVQFSSLTPLFRDLDFAPLLRGRGRGMVRHCEQGVKHRAIEALFR